MFSTSQSIDWTCHAKGSILVVSIVLIFEYGPCVEEGKGNIQYILCYETVTHDRLEGAVYILKVIDNLDDDDVDDYPGDWSKDYHTDSIGELVHWFFS